MIFYFSGTGNSLYAAKSIARHTNEKLISIAKVLEGDAAYQLGDNEVIGFVFPIHSWGPPNIVLQCIERLQLSNYRQNYIFCVSTCGGSAGSTMEVMSTCLRKKQMRLSSGFSVIMPNNFIIMGDVDAKEKEQEKLLLAEETLAYINQAIEQRAEEFRVKKGYLPWLLTYGINPMFNKYGIVPKKFYATDQCVGCGICEKVCNLNNITVQQKPHWGSNCVLCLACVHYCPVKAVQYGKGTETKGRYTNPKISIEEKSRFEK